MIVEKEKIRFIVDIVDHCNLNCKCCGHFSPLAPKGFLDINTFERDLKRLHELLYGHIRRTRQTLWRAVQMLTQKLSCQTIHDCPKVVPLHYESEWQ